MSEGEREGRFLYHQIAAYIQNGTYPDGFNKADKLALRKRTKFFTLRDSCMYYIGGTGGINFCLQFSMCIRTFCFCI